MEEWNSSEKSYQEDYKNLLKDWYQNNEQSLTNKRHSFLMQGPNKLGLSVNDEPRKIFNDIRSWSQKGEKEIKFIEKLKEIYTEDKLLFWLEEYEKHLEIFPEDKEVRNLLLKTKLIFTRLYEYLSEEEIEELWQDFSVTVNIKNVEGQMINKLNNNLNLHPNIRLKKSHMESIEKIRGYILKEYVDIINIESSSNPNDYDNDYLIDAWWSFYYMYNYLNEKYLNYILSPKRESPSYLKEIIKSMSYYQDLISKCYQILQKKMDKVSDYGKEMFAVLTNLTENIINVQ